MTVKEYPRKRARKHPLTYESDYMGKSVKEKEREEKILRERKKNWPCAHRDLNNGDRVSHWNEVSRLKRVIGQLKGIIKMIEGREFKCNTALDQLLSAIVVLRKIGLFMLQRHMIECLKEKDFPGTPTEMANEIRLAMEYIPKLVTPDAMAKSITGMIEEIDGEKLKIIEHEKKILGKDE